MTPTSSGGASTSSQPNTPSTRIQERVHELTARINEYEDTYDAATPAAVDAITAVEKDNDWTIDDVYSDLGDWATAREERRRYERARQQRTSTETEQVSG